MSHIRADASLVGHHVPDLAGTVMAGTQQEMASLREELDPLDSTFVSLPGMQPLLGDEAVMLFVAEIGGSIDEALSGDLAQLVAVAMVDRSHLSFKREHLFLLRILHFLLALVFVSLHELLLVLSQICLLALEFLHTFVGCPWALEISGGCLAEFLSFHLHLSSFSLP